MTINAKDYVEVLGGSPTGRSAISTSALGSGDAGSMRINAGRLSIRDGGQVSTSTLGKGKGGNLTVNADRSVELIGTSIDGRFFSALAASAESRSSGNAGDLTITTPDLLVRDGAQVSTGTFGTGKGGNLFVNASNKVELIGISADGRTVSALGASAQTGSSGNAGNLTIETQDLFIRDGATVITATFGTGNGGNLTVNASGSVEVIGASANGLFNSRLSTSANQDLTGNAGGLTINAQNLLVRDGGQVDAATFGQGKGGNLTVNATGKVELIGTSADVSLFTTLATSAEAGSTGDAGDLAINAQDLFVRDRAQIIASTSGRGKAGNLTINASGKIELIGISADSSFVSGLSASTNQDSTGDAGKLTITTQDLLVRNGAAISTATFGAGNAGIMSINANTIRLDNKASLNANTRSPNKDPNREQATINLNTQNLTLRQGSSITTDATGENVIGGNININTKFLIAPENSRISANSDNSRGGQVRINAQGVFVGTQPSDVSQYITAKSGVGLSGNVDVNSPDNSSIQNSLTSFPTNAIDTNALIANSCIARANQKQENSFIITGGGALPNRPGNLLMSNYSTDRVRGVNNEITLRPWKKGDRIIEPTGVYRLSDGRLVMSRPCE
ncbi:S-layer family protein [Nostoc sp. ChiQUE01b]|uniref:beta strand repeat-containing protein n=1 Tax=Nostoc sp. ChiQUE01b TaxID=3075376 RepID=UPI002AD397F3|nr:S-layer family protein [Nostoc sp. ChiQUE01b]MDZ8237653.1 S-layer family protein [Nostoc sp. ChiQUE01a]MDZ8264646.1 S-layer family protein [Nostoc sp. ChiQUE01b]